MAGRGWLCVLGWLLTGLLAAGCCGGGSSSSSTSSSSSSSSTADPTPTSSPSAVTVDSAVFCKGLTEQMAPLNPSSFFYPTEKINLSVAFPGRPRSGKVAATYMYRQEKIAEAEIDFSSVNSGVIFSIGSKTYVGFWLTHEKALSVSPMYKVVVTVDGAPAGEFPFQVLPPVEAIPSKLLQAVLARGVAPSYAPIEPTTTFSPTDLIHVTGLVDLGVHSWIQAEWYVGGQKLEAMTRHLQATQNAPSTPFTFNARPEGGWPPGQHLLKLVLNDQELGAFPFTIAGAPATPGAFLPPPGAAPLGPPVAPMPAAPPGLVPPTGP